MTTFVEQEIADQPRCWSRAADEAATLGQALPAAGERVAVVGCGTSWFMAMSYAALREGSGQGVTDAYVGSEMPATRPYDRVVAITRSGTTTEIIDLLDRWHGTPRTVLTAVAGTPVTDRAEHTICLDFADEQSVVQTRFATTVLSLLRAHLGADLQPVIRDAQTALQLPVNEFATATQITFLGRGWTIGLAQEAALKTREAAQFWAEAYPALDYRHGPIAIAQPDRIVWSLGTPPPGLAHDVQTCGGVFVHQDLDPQAQLVLAQRVAVALAQARGLDPDHPRHLTRSVVLAAAHREP